MDSRVRCSCLAYTSYLDSSYIHTTSENKYVRSRYMSHYINLTALSQSERHLYILQDRLIVQNKQTHQAQMNERAEADSKRRLTS
jgi:hypothetical protein